MDISQSSDDTVRLSGYDTMFVLDDRIEPQHTLKIAVFDEASSKDFQFERIGDALQRAVAVLPQMKWRVQPVPLGLNRPVWVVDSEFDVRNHLRHVRLPHPGTKTQLCHMIGELAAERIPPDRPPWQLWFLEGFQGTKVVGVLKLNHAMADGGTCAELLDVLSRPEPNAPPVAVPVPHPAAASSRSDVLRDGARDLWHEVGREVPRMARAMRQARPKGRKSGSLKRQPSRLGAPTIPWRGPLTPTRSFAWVSLPLDEVKEIAKTVSGTVNDVVFAIVAGAVRECLAHEAMLTDRPVIADTAAKNRREGDTRLWGNAVTVRRFELPTHLADPLERLRAAHVQSLSVKSQVAARHVQFEDWVALVPPILLRPVLRAVRTAARRSRLSGYVMVSNVKGPREKRYIGGMGIENFISCGHLKYAAGVNTTVWSYDKVLNFAVYGCGRTLPDAELFTERIHLAFDELHATTRDLAGPPEHDSVAPSAARGEHHV
ncbi:MAG TPA: wax ester/triacylglycerol synthase family O-acyltransferase [Mycobacterium sp.]|uniref:wax ester/triacylglycerol synthase family O-acyltransferase n=1 Tax=Mycobacterium sp. TaxID=1785 RepID=UPI002BC58E07|nr:wax ester/triacylglycerol synthase family O-acyltransferase [Mycobacterium sp.]HME79532.1 wax ester/triacylglycerol synthase family O-acyltransferase [Mycobacterium sp.]